MDRGTPTQGIEDMDTIDETTGLAAVEFDLRIRAHEIEARESALRAREEALENAEQLLAMRRTRMEPVEEQSDISIPGFRPGNEDQPLQSTRIEEDSRRTRTTEEEQRGRSRDRNTQPDVSGNPRSPSYETVRDQTDGGARPRRPNPIDPNPRRPNPTDPTQNPYHPYPPQFPFPYPYAPPPPSNPYYPNPTGNNLQCDVINKKPTIVKWYGKIGEELGQDLETFIQSVDEHLENVKFRNPKDALTEAKSYFDTSKGDWKFYATSIEYHKITTWEQLKAMMRRVYSSVSANDPVIALQKILRQIPKQNSDFVAFAGMANSQTNAWHKILDHSHWCTNGKIDSRDVATLVNLAMILSYLPESMVKVMNTKWGPDHGIVEIYAHVQERRSFATNLDLSKIVQKDPKMKRKDGSVNMVQKNGVTKENESSTFNVNQNNVRKGQSNKFCSNCQTNTHNTRDCRKLPFCKHHQTTGHRTSECRTVVNRPNNNNYRQDRPANQPYRNQGISPRYMQRDQSLNYRNYSRQNVGNNVPRRPNNYNNRPQDQARRQGENNPANESRHNAVSTSLPRSQEGGNFQNPTPNRGER